MRRALGSGGILHRFTDFLHMGVELIISRFNGCRIVLLKGFLQSVDSALNIIDDLLRVVSPIPRDIEEVLECLRFQCSKGKG